MLSVFSSLLFFFQVAQLSQFDDELYKVVGKGSEVEGDKTVCLLKMTKSTKRTLRAGQ